MSNQELVEALENEVDKKAEQAKLRGKILDLEAAMLAQPENLIHIEPVHYFANNLYAREITIPKDVTLTGHIHKTEHFCVLSKGEVSVYTEDGIKRLKASSVVHSLPGTKRVLYAHEESVWINFHHNPTNENDPEKMEEIFTVKNFEELENFELKKIEGGK